MTAPHRKVVLLDDSPTVRKMVAFRLTGAGYEVKAVQNVTELTTALGEGQPDVVLLDVMMPEFFGDDLVAYVRTHAPGAAVLFFSSLEAEKLKELVQSANADGYLCKTDGFREVSAGLDAFFLGRGGA